MPAPADPDALSRRLASIVGLAVGDALGTTNESQPAGSFPPVTDMVGGGPFDLPAGGWTDDTAMALCLAESLVEAGWDPADQMHRYLRWWREGHWSSTGDCFDIGRTTRHALARFAMLGDPLVGAAGPDSLGNGSVMRLAPVVAWAAGHPSEAIRLARESSCTTHAATECVDGCELLARLLLQGMWGEDLTLPVAVAGAEWSDGLREVAAMHGAPAAEPPRKPTGYVVDTLACARWCVARGTTFREAVLLAANLGGDADTIAAVTGQLAGARWGMEGIPAEWVDRLARRDEVLALAGRVVGASFRQDDRVGVPPA